MLMSTAMARKTDSAQRLLSEAVRDGIEQIALSSAAVLAIPMRTIGPRNQNILLRQGSFASPIIEGVGPRIFPQLCETLTAYFKEPLRPLINELDIFCSAFSTKWITAQLLGKLPVEMDAGYCNNTEIFHRDFDEIAPRQLLVRLVRTYVGEGTHFISGSKNISITPPNHALLFRGGVKTGLRHRSPSVGTGRVILIMSHALPMQERHPLRIR
jgi:hypothetical protein